MTRTHCKNDHEKTPENTFKDGRCKRCQAAYQASRRDKINARRRERYVNDSNYAESIRAAQRRRYAANPEPSRKRMRERYRNETPEVRKARLEIKAHYQRVKGYARTQARYAADPALREKLNAKRREQYAELMKDPVKAAARREYYRIYQEARRRRQGIPERRWTDKSGRGDDPALHGRRLDPRPFVRWVERFLAENDMTARDLGRAAGMNDLTLARYRDGMGVSLRTVAKVLGVVDANVRTLYDDNWEPILFAPPRLRLVAPPSRCKSGDDCARAAGHGPSGRFCVMHGAELQRIKAEMDAHTAQWAELARERQARRLVAA